MEVIVKSTTILLIAFATAAMMRRASASARHLMWVAAFTCLLILPLLSTFAPGWSAWKRLAVLPAGAVAIPVGATETSSPGPVRPPHGSNADWLLILWAAGAAVVSLRTVAGLLRLRALAASAMPIDAAAPVTVSVRRSPRVAVPITFGVRRPVVLLPQPAADWPAEKLRNVMAHETAHIRRRDWLVHLGVRFACALYWFHPLAWMAAGQMARERERACDDHVLRTGVAGSAYAAHLLEFISSATAVPLSVGMAERAAFFEHRVRAILDPRLNRRPVARAAAVLTFAIAVAVLLPLATVRASAQSSDGAALHGIVYDPSGATVPGATVVLLSGGQPTTATVTTDDGTFQFAATPAGVLSIEVQKPGFRTTLQKIAAGMAADRVSFVLEIGSATENIDVLGNMKAPASSPQKGPQRIRVGGDVQAVKLLKMVRPVYPEHLQQQGVEGAIVIRAVISTEGNLLSTTVMNSAADPDLAKAALDAVGQWRYAPTLLNGEPIEVVTTITVNFRLPR